MYAYVRGTDGSMDDWKKEALHGFFRKRRNIEIIFSLKKI